MQTNTKQKAKEAFEYMDDNGGGVILLNEWCAFIKHAEIRAGTYIGELLAMDEAAPEVKSSISTPWLAGWLAG